MVVTSYQTENYNFVFFSLVVIDCANLDPSDISIFLWIIFSDNIFDCQKLPCVQRENCYFFWLKLALLNYVIGKFDDYLGLFWVSLRLDILKLLFLKFMMEENVILSIDTSYLLWYLDTLVIYQIGVNAPHYLTDFRPHSPLTHEHDVLKFVVDESFKHRNI